MEQYISKSALVTEIQRLQDLTMDKNKNFYSEAAEGEYNALCNIEHFIDFLQEESVSKDLEEEIEEYWKNAPTGTLYFPMWEHFQIIAHHFAEWGKKQAEIEIQAQSMALAYGCPKETVSEGLEEVTKDTLDTYKPVFSSSTSEGEPMQHLK